MLWPQSRPTVFPVSQHDALNVHTSPYGFSWIIPPQNTIGATHSATRHRNGGENGQRYVVRGSRRAEGSVFKAHTNGIGEEKTRSDDIFIAMCKRCSCYGAPLFTRVSIL
jgi:hypothetical protein